MPQPAIPEKYWKFILCHFDFGLIKNSCTKFQNQTPATNAQLKAINNCFARININQK